MRTVYEISRQRFPTEAKRAEWRKVTRRDVAERELWSQIYNMLDANGLRDRPIALKLARQFDECDISPTKLGYIRTVVFALDEYARVELRIYRE